MIMYNIALSFFLLLTLRSYLNHAANRDDWVTEEDKHEDASNDILYQVSLQSNVSGQWRHICGGAIISHDHVITAGDCVNAKSLVAGTRSLRNIVSRYDIKDITMHPNFTRRVIDYNIAILEVSPPFVFDGAESLVAVSLPTIDEVVHGGVLMNASSWIRTTPNQRERVPDTLQTFMYQTITNEECRAKNLPVTPNVLCAVSVSGQRTCNGDSGMPLVVASGGGYAPKLVGILISGTTGCGAEGTDVYQRVANLVSWINDVKMKSKRY